MSATNAALASAGLALTAYLSGCLLPGRGLQDLLVSGAIWRTSTDAVALTFDDGPHPTWTPRILDLLANAGVSASFFLVGQQAERFPDLVRRIAEEGHCIGNHGWSHRSMSFLRSADLDSEIDRCQEVINSITGEAPRFIRPPYGRRDYRTYRAARLRGLVPTLWSVDSHDWLFASSARITSRLNLVDRGDVVLLHDGQDDATATLSATAALLSRLSTEGVIARALSFPVDSVGRVTNEVPARASERSPDHRSRSRMK